MPTRKSNRKQPRKPGRPTAYKDQFCQEAASRYGEGATDIEVADALGIDVRTLYRWHHEHPEFRQASQLGKDAADARVERSLYNRAVGYSYDAVKIMQNNGRPVVVPFREHVPPDTGAAIKWLSNRRPDEWRERMEHTGPNGGPIPVAVVNVSRTSSAGHSTP